MLRIQFATFPLIIATISFLVVVGCEAPQQTAPVQKQTLKQTPKTDSQPIIATANNNRVDVLRGRIVDTYTRYWPLISSEHQHDQLPSVLGDPMEELRIFGIERVGVFIRDGEATEEELQLVIDRLTDKSPDVRLAAATLLPEISVVGIADYVADVLTNEDNQEVIEQELIFFQTVSHPCAILPTIQRLRQNPMGEAANTIIYLLNTNDVSEKTKNDILQIVLKSRQRDNIPALLTLEAMLGNNETKKRLIRLLDYQDKTIRVAVALGFAYAGFSEPLIRRSNDPVIYTYALLALQENKDIASFKKLLDIQKEDDSNWETAVFTIASSLNMSELLRANDMLARLKLDELRLSILSDVWKNASSKNHAVRKTIAGLLIPLMIKLGDAVGALQLLDVFEESLIDDDLITLQFIAAMNASAWDAAEDARPDPDLWIAEWEKVQTIDPNAANVMKKQIIQRFIERLTPEQLKLLEIEPAAEIPEETS
jgi:hypothetical protein